MMDHPILKLNNSLLHVHNIELFQNRKEHPEIKADPSYKTYVSLNFRCQQDLYI